MRRWWVVLAVALFLAGCASEANPLARCVPRDSASGYDVTVRLVPREAPAAGACIEARVGAEVTRSPDAFRVVADGNGVGRLRLGPGSWTVSATIYVGGACADLDTANVSVPSVSEVVLNFNDAPARRVCI